MFVHDTLPGRIVFGAGSVDGIAAEADRLQLRRVLLVASPSSTAAGDRIATALGDRLAGRFGEVRQHVPEDLGTAARARAAAVRADSVITVGGGSATGLGKVIAVEARVPLVAVPTTYAGSEVTPIFGMTGEHKRTARDLLALPQVVVYDPLLSIGLSREVTVTTGFNALAHGIEALYAPGANPVVRLHALEGIRNLSRGLPVVAVRPDDIDARTTTLFGAYLTGVALAGSGTALHHKLCHVLGGTFGLAHGACNAVVLPHVVAYNAGAAPDAMSDLAGALRDGGLIQDVTGADPATTLHQLAQRLGAPASLGALGMREDDLERAADLTIVAVGSSNPRKPDPSTVRALLQRAFAGDPPTVT